ncbi:hypothetical protein AB0G74_19075 [Streptomyces sp. NPDC020875]|uniref:hypothetical protein n=1 Tax=Streptomyces sp. NPDC020875 TaxID=3154898 RepID=UPI0033FB62C0
MDTATDPDRPEGVPADAEAEEDGGWALGPVDAEGRTGVWRSWRADGSFAGTAHWRAGLPHGEQILLHDDGSVAVEGKWHEGKRVRLRHRRADGPSRETGMDQLPETVRVMIQDFDEAGYFIRQRFHTADGTEVDPEGEPIPPRPANVPEVAQHTTRHGHWYHQRFEPCGEQRNVGLHRFWETDGTFKSAEYHTAEGGLLARIGPGTTGRGNPLVEAARAGDAAAVEACLALGLGTSPGAALHAAYEEQPELARRLTAEAAGDGGTERAEFTDPRAEPERRDGIPDDAVWVPGLLSWAAGTALDPVTGAATGTWRLWRSKPYLQADQPVVAEFSEGRMVRRREYLPWRPDRLEGEWRYDGDRVLHRSFERGVRDAETEDLPDGTVAHRRFDGDTRLVERVERDGALVAEVWFAEDGTRSAEVCPATATAGDEAEPVEWWRGLDESGAVIAEGAVRPGLKGGPVGEWRLYGPDGAEGPVVGFGDLRVRRTGDLGRFAHGLHGWRTMSPPAALAGVDEVDWAAYRPFFGASEDVPFLLKGLAAAEPLVSRYALGVLWDMLLHQHTVSDVAGPAMRFVIALAEAAPDAADLPEFVLHVVTRDGDLEPTGQLKGLYASAAGTEKPEEYFAEYGVEPAYHRIYGDLAAAVPTWARAAAGAPGADPELRRIAFHLLAVAPGEAAATALRELTAAEAGRGAGRDPRTLAELLLCLALVPGDATRDLLEPFLADEDPLAAFCAALSWVRTDAGPAARALPALVDALTDPPGLDGFGGLWFAGGGASGDAIGALSLLPPEHSRELLGRMCALLGEASSFSAPGIARSVLDIVFPTEAYEEGAALTADQAVVVRAIADTVASRDVVSVNLNEVLRYNGLPCTAPELRALRTVEGG